MPLIFLSFLKKREVGIVQCCIWTCGSSSRWVEHACRIVLLATFFGSGSVIAAQPAAADDFQTSTRAAWVFDMTTNTVMLDHNSDEPLPPASMTKLMTLYLLFEALEEGRLRLGDILSVSEHAASRGGSTMFLDPRDRPTVEELIQGITVMSGNDAAIVVAEALAGSEEAFSGQMNSTAQEMGLQETHFTNASGWPGETHLMSARDVGTLAVRLIEDFPQHYHYFSLREFEFDGRAPANRYNRNPMLGLSIGADGLKTGHLDEVGYGLVSSVLQDDRRIVFAFMGAENSQQRARVGREIALWAFNNYRARTVFHHGEFLAYAEVWLGERSQVELTVSEDITLLFPIDASSQVTANVIYTAPLQAPISEGQSVGVLEINVDQMPPIQIPVVASENVEAGGFSVRVQAAAYLLFDRARSFISEQLLPG